MGVGLGVGVGVEAAVGVGVVSGDMVIVKWCDAGLVSRKAPRSSPSNEIYLV